MKSFCKKILLLVAIIGLTTGCDKDKGDGGNPYLPNYAFSVDINRNLPLYSKLQFVGDPVTVNITGAGIRGLIVMNVGGGGYVAFDRACPNQDLAACSTLTLDGIQAVCPCDDARYNLFTGVGSSGPYPLKQYRTEVNGNIIRIFN